MSRTLELVNDLEVRELETSLLGTPLDSRTRHCAIRRRERLCVSRGNRPLHEERGRAVLGAIVIEPFDLTRQRVHRKLRSVQHADLRELTIVVDDPLVVILGLTSFQELIRVCPQRALIELALIYLRRLHLGREIFSLLTLRLAADARYYQHG